MWYLIMMWLKHLHASLIQGICDWETVLCFLASMIRQNIWDSTECARIFLLESICKWLSCLSELNHGDYSVDISHPGSLQQTHLSSLMWWKKTLVATSLGHIPPLIGKNMGIPNVIDVDSCIFLLSYYSHREFLPFPWMNCSCHPSGFRITMASLLLA